MLFAGCSNCRKIVPLFCAGQMFPHPPLYVQPSPFGVACGYCGPLRPVWTCMNCGAMQILYIQGAPTPVGVAQLQGLRLAPVVDAPQGASEGAVASMMKEAGTGFANEFGKGLASQLLGAFFGGT